jgi:hypothetical protein
MKNKCWTPWFILIIVLFAFAVWVSMKNFYETQVSPKNVYIFQQTEQRAQSVPTHLDHHYNRHIYHEPQHHTKQVGFLQSADGQQTLPLYSRPSSTHKYRYNYFTRSLDLGIPIPVFYNQRNCTESLGCDELYDGNQVTIPGTFEPLTVNMYARDFCF